MPNDSVSDESLFTCPVSAGGKSPSTALITVQLPPNGQQPDGVQMLCRMPSTQDLAIVFNRLLKFAFPVQRNLPIYERFINRQQQPPKLSKKMLESLPAPTLEGLAHQIWTQALPSRFAHENQVLSLLLLMEDLVHFKAEQWVRQDIQLIGARDPGGLHSYYFEGQLDSPTLHRVLSEHRYRTDYLAVASTQSMDPLLLGYLLCRTLSHVPPWVELIETMQLYQAPACQEAYPLLARLASIYRLWQSERRFEQLSLAPHAIAETVGICHQWLASSACREIAMAHHLVRPVREWVLVEGATEERLLPEFARCLGIDFYERGIFIQPAGGKNQVFQLYDKFAETLNVPIFVVLDRDAQDRVAAWEAVKRPEDQLFLMSEGEIEDTYDVDLLLKTINMHYHPHPRLTREDLERFSQPPELSPLTRVQTLRAVWKAYQLGDFDKIRFADRLADSLDSPRQVPLSIRQLVQAIVSTCHG